MLYDFDKLIDRRGTNAMKIEELPAGCPEDSLSAWVADMDFPCAQPILDALHERIDRQILGYTRYHAENGKQAVKNWFLRRFGWEIKAEEICHCPGVVPALAFLIEALTQPGDGIVIQKPVYYPFSAKIKGAGRTVVNSPLVRREREGGRFDYVMDLTDLDRKLSQAKNKGLIISSPHNPVGRVWTKEELRGVLELGKKHNKWIISDEIHCDLTRVGQAHTPLLKLVDEMAEEDDSWKEYRKQVAVCTAPSKTFNIAGLCFSNIIVPEGGILREKWNETLGDRFHLDYVCNPLSQVGMIAAYNEGEEWLEQIRAYLDGNIAYIEGFLKEHLPKAKMAHCQGTYLVWIDCSGYCDDAQKLEQAMQQIGRVALDEGYIFGSEGAGYERINIAMPRSMVEDCMVRMEKALTWLENHNE